MSRLLFSLVLALGCTAPVFAEAKPKPNTLTPKEIADGWILLFDGETTFGWKVEGDAAMKEGVLVVGGPKRGAYAHQAMPFGAYEMTFEVRRIGPSKARLGIQVTYTTSEGGDGSSLASRDVDLLCEASGEWKLAKVVAEAGPKNTYAYKLNDDKPVSTRPDPKIAIQYFSRLGVTVEPGGQLFLRNLKLRPLGTKPLFNGKDLDGWKVTQTDPKRTATKFEVNKEGELSAKNGPGDLQTEKQFDDFVLQFECKTNGLALNSGIFFRCMPDAYQNGYEAQIQNAYLGDRTKPIDYGTGAIYRRVAARKVVSNDNEWFTMTVAARGAHIATWVNGYQTVDWTDDRKANDNPRQGLRTAKGHLSIQGHDPTTDLLFRNIRIAELPKP